MYSRQLKSYQDIRVLQILLIGTISGFPWVLIGSVMTLWLKDEGLSRSAIGLFGYVFAVFAINFLWAPLVDTIRIPYLAHRIGQRKAWILLMQAVILLASLVMYLLSAQTALVYVAVTALVIAAAAATQDIAIDALRIELVAKSEQALVVVGAAMATAGWYSGYNAGGALALYAVAALKEMGVEQPWNLVYLLMTGVIILCNIGLMLIPEKSAAKRLHAQQQTRAAVYSDLKRNADIDHYAATFVAWFVSLVWKPLADFFYRNGLQLSLLILGFIFLFKIGEAFLGRMSLLFYSEVGFSEAQIATYSKLVGWGSISAFAIIGSLFSVRFGLFKGLIICGIAMAATNLLFALLAVVGNDIRLFAVAVIGDQFTTAISTVAFVAFISQLCGRIYTATQYALLASLGNLSRTVLSAHSGQLVDFLGGDWLWFFILTTVMVIPSLVLLYLARHQLAPHLRLRE
ncbi:MAG: MFS transporter [Chromatiales bacterium]|nr:MFS transporter [Chromatiales bacterium]